MKKVFAFLFLLLLIAGVGLGILYYLGYTQPIDLTINGTAVETASTGNIFPLEATMTLASKRSNKTVRVLLAQDIECTIDGVVVGVPTGTDVTNVLLVTHEDGTMTITAPKNGIDGVMAALYPEQAVETNRQYINPMADLFTIEITAGGADTVTYGFLFPAIDVTGVTVERSLQF